MYNFLFSALRHMTYLSRHRQLISGIELYIQCLNIWTKYFSNISLRSMKIVVHSGTANGRFPSKTKPAISISPPRKQRERLQRSVYTLGLWFHFKSRVIHTMSRDRARTSVSIVKFSQCRDDKLYIILVWPPCDLRLRRLRIDWLHS